MPVFELGAATGRLLIGSGSLSSDDSEISISNLNFNYYTKFTVEFKDIVPSSDGADFSMSFLSGASVKSGTYEAGEWVHRMGSASTTTANNDTGATDVALSHNAGSGTDENCEFDITITKLMGNKFNTLHWTGYRANSAGNKFNSIGRATLEETSATQADGFKVFFSTGDIEAGASWKVYAYRDNAA